VPIETGMTSGAPAAVSVVSHEAVFFHARKLPSAPQVLATLCELLQDVNVNLDLIAIEIRIDPSLAARVIRMSNSAVFGVGQRVGSVDEAVNRVGLGEVIRLVGAATVAALVERSLQCYAVGDDRFRESLLLHGLAAEALAAYTELDSRVAYSAGLLRGIGMMVLDRAGRARLPSPAYDPARFPAYAEWELAAFGITAAHTTAVVLDEWRFPSEFVAAIENHRLQTPAGFRNRFACLLNLAGAIVMERGYALPGESSYWTLSPRKLAGLGISDDQFRCAAAQAGALFERQRRALF
jgi:HD-like signal output (HDOD) protein